MASGDASRTWFSEMVEALRQEWRPDMPWEQVIALCDRLEAMLQEIRSSRQIRLPTMWCPSCNERTQQAPPSVSVRALIFALGRFGIAPQAEVKSLEKRWAKHRKENSLDRNGRPSEPIITPSSHAPSGFHSDYSSEGTLVVGEQHSQEAGSGGFTHDGTGRRPR